MTDQQAHDIRDLIFVRAFSQECDFVRAKSPISPKHYKTTCAKLWEIYPDLDEAEMFIRAQFVLRNQTDVCLGSMVHNFSHLVADKYHEAYQEYKRIEPEQACRLVDMAYESKMTHSAGGHYPWQSGVSPLGRYWIAGDKARWGLQEVVAIECLHFPSLVGKLPLTAHTRARIQFHKDELRKGLTKCW
jgi:hypothetical protein